MLHTQALWSLQIPAIFYGWDDIEAYQQAEMNTEDYQQLF
jgi:hypothetical protein